MKNSKILKPGFTDHRTGELITELKDVVRSFAVMEELSYARLIGILEMVKLDLYKEGVDE